MKNKIEKAKEIIIDWFKQEPIVKDKGMGIQQYNRLVMILLTQR